MEVRFNPIKSHHHDKWQAEYELLRLGSEVEQTLTCARWNLSHKTVYTACLLLLRLGLSNSSSDES